MRLIDADALKEKLRKLPRWIVRKDNSHNEGFTYDQVFFAIDAQPEEIVRCADCALWNDGKCDVWSALGVTILTAETGYCNFGERRDDGRPD